MEQSNKFVHKSNDLKQHAHNKNKFFFSILSYDVFSEKRSANLSFFRLNLTFFERLGTHS